MVYKKNPHLLEEAKSVKEDKYAKELNNYFIPQDTYSYLNDDSGFTFRSNDLFKRIDYIICSHDLNPKESEVC